MQWSNLIGLSLWRTHPSQVHPSQVHAVAWPQSMIYHNHDVIFCHSDIYWKFYLRLNSSKVSSNLCVIHELPCLISEIYMQRILRKLKRQNKDTNSFISRKRSVPYHWVVKVEMLTPLTLAEKIIPPLSLVENKMGPIQVYLKIPPLEDWSKFNGCKRHILEKMDWEKGLRPSFFWEDENKPTETIFVLWISLQTASYMKKSRW